MEPQHKNTLAKCSLFIKKNITNFGEVLDNLLQDDCIKWDERSTIGQEKSINEQCQMLIEILIRRGGMCYDSFIDALAFSGNNHVVDEIENTGKKLGIGDRKTSIVEELCEEKNRSINTLQARVSDLEVKLKAKKDKLTEVHDQQVRALDDLKRLKEKNNHKEKDIKILEMKNQDMEKEINRLKETIDYLQKQICIKDISLKRAEEEKRKMSTDHLKAIQNLERKQDLTQKTCENLSENVVALTKAFASLHGDITRQQKDNLCRNQGLDAQGQPESTRTQTTKRDLPLYKGFRASPHKLATSNTGVALWKNRNYRKKEAE